MKEVESLYIETTKDAKAALELVLPYFKIEAPVEVLRWKDDIAIHAAALSAQITTIAKYIANTPGARSIHQNFGFWTSVSISFSPLKEDYRFNLHEILIGGTLELVQDYTFDLVLAFYYGERVVLKRSAGELVLNMLPDIWTPERLALVTMPYSMQALPNG